jgi:hypothetical protein
VMRWSPMGWIHRLLFFDPGIPVSSFESHR